MDPRSYERLVHAALPVLAALALSGCASTTNGPTGTGGSGSSSGSSYSGSSSSGSSAGSGSSSGASGNPGGADDDATAGGDAMSGDDGGSSNPQDDGSCAVNHSTQTTFVNLAPPMLSALDRNRSDPLIGDAGGAVPAGWNFYQIDGAICRDGSPNGIYVRYTGSDKLMIYLEGGGACLSPHFCDHNPANINEMFSGGADVQGQSFNSILFDNLMSPLVPQQPWSTGVFDFTRTENPFNGWNQVYIPYCTGDVHFGTIDQGTVPDSVVPGRHFVGYYNMQKFIGHIVPTFPDVKRVVLTGSSAGGLGAALNYGMVQDAFTTKVPVTVLDDSGAGFPDLQYMPACFQKQLRDTFGWDNAIPSDCAACRQPDGSGLMEMIKYWHIKYAKGRIGLVMSIHDQIFRLFFASSANNCANDDPNLLTTLGLQGGNVPGYPASLWESAMLSLRSTYDCSGAFSTYYIGDAMPDAGTANDGTIDTLHMHIFRDRFYSPLAGGTTIAQWATDFLNGKMEDVGP